MTNLKGKHLLSTEDLTLEATEYLLQIAEQMTPFAKRRKITRVLEGAVLANLFFEPSTRTRLSFAAAFCRLGGAVCDITDLALSSMAKGESIQDTSRVVAGFADIMVVRHPEQGSAAQFATATHIPVINGGDGPGEHPTQALIDLYTIKKEFARLDKNLKGATIAFVGDLKYSRTTHSLLKLLALYRDIHFVLITPPSFEMPPTIVDQIARNGHVIEQLSSLQGLKNVDVIYATRVQKERIDKNSNTLTNYAADFQLNSQALVKAKAQNAIIMHPLPRDSRAGANDLSTDLNNNEQLAIFRQSDNGIAVRMALFSVILGVEHLVLRNLRDVLWFTPKQIGTQDASFHRLKA